MDRRDCGCVYQMVGLGLHVRHVRSFEKFTSEGMNYFYGDLFELFEKIQPAEFGGGPGDYQLVEEEDGRGRLRLALSSGSRGNRFMAGVWENAGTFRLKREFLMPARAEKSFLCTFPRHGVNSRKKRVVSASESP